ncbi:MAG: 30S ribosomal protein S20 [Patescibacteria group bacterium]
MPITKSAKKALRASKKRRESNLHRKDNMKSAFKEVERFVKEGKKKEAIEALSRAYKAIDKATKRGVIKKNTAARKKSKLSAKVNKSK